MVLRARLASSSDQEDRSRMSDLAFNANGDVFDVPAQATAWRVRRLRPRGAPELVYGRDGLPLTISIDAGIEELRDAVESAGKYRLDALSEDGRCVDGVPAAYVQVTKLEVGDEQQQGNAIHSR